MPNYGRARVSRFVPCSTVDYYILGLTPWRKQLWCSVALVQRVTWAPQDWNQAQEERGVQLIASAGLTPAKVLRTRRFYEGRKQSAAQWHIIYYSKILHG